MSACLYTRPCLLHHCIGTSRNSHSGVRVSGMPKLSICASRSFRPQVYVYICVYIYVSEDAGTSLYLRLMARRIVCMFRPLPRCVTMCMFVCAYLNVYTYELHMSSCECICIEAYARPRTCVCVGASIFTCMCVYISLYWHLKMSG